MTRWTAAPALVMALLCLSACSSTSAPAPTSPAPASSTASAPSTPSAATAATGIPVSPSPSDVAATSAGAYPSAEACAYLQSQIPALTAIGTPAGVQANLAGGLYTFFTSHGLTPDGMALDDATAKQCPALRTQVLTMMQLKSFAQL
ncbi:hypothetical protein [Lapillicoccus sp.]|uniref:hypothetical protein n=1 Tax=Lapillicoccus sp. TaxID=1909287 RepID=UPI0025D30A8D|nr:hypothetical protein [Lapillicoccus sp.]